MGMKVVAVVLDSVGLGSLPDASEFGDEGADTLDHTVLKTGLRLQNLAALGLGHISGVHTVPQVSDPKAAFGRMEERNRGKDTTTGHWEFVGIHLAHPFRTFPEGFPEEVIEAFERAIGRGVLLNRPYSGTEAIKDYGEVHLETGKPIVYTSADSVFQIAAHVDIVPLETLYEWSQKAREILQGEYAVARVIARPFAGPKGSFYRLNEHRRDFALKPPENVLDRLHSSGIEVVGVGKIPDIYAHRGFTREVHTDDNTDGIKKTLALMAEPFEGLIFTNLVDFDAKYGHRRDPLGYACALAEFDRYLPKFLEALGDEDYLFIISDHGNDPTFPGTDHTREYGLLLVVGPGMAGRELGTRRTFADVGASWARLFGVDWDGPGEAVL